MRSVLKFLLLGSASIYLGMYLAYMPDAPPTRLSFLAVGQGDCTVFQHQGYTVLIDTAPRNDRADATARIAVPELYRLGVRAIDILIITHPDADHAAGLGTLAKRFAIGIVCIPVAFQQHPDMNKWLQEARIKNENVAWINRARIHLNDFEIALAAPRLYAGESDNDGSMFTRISGQNSSAIGTGDASIEIESKMILALKWKCDILKAGHHGSKYGTGLRILHETKPAYVVFSCGRNNVYGHPTPEAMERVDAVGAKSLRTDRDGTITFVPSEHGFVPANP